MISQIILITLTFASTILGACFSSTRWTKALFIALAFGTSAATTAIEYSNERDKEFIKDALASQLSTSKHPSDFIHALHATVQSIAHKHGINGDMHVTMMSDGSLF